MTLHLTTRIYQHQREHFPTLNVGSEGLVNKERQLAGLQLEKKEREAELWRKRFMQLQASCFARSCDTISMHSIVYSHCT